MEMLFIIKIGKKIKKIKIIKIIINNNINKIWTTNNKTVNENDEPNLEELDSLETIKD